MKSAILKFSLALIVGMSSVSLATPDCRYFYSEKDLSINTRSDAVQTTRRNGHIFKLIKLNQVSRDSLEYAQAQKYLTQIFPESLSKLNKDQDFFNQITRTNRELWNQMNVLLMFEKGDPDTIIAGTSFVVAKNRDEQMAFQAELPGISVSQVGAHGYPVAEIARVGTAANVDGISEKFRLLIDTVFEVTMTSMDVRTFYAFTSRLHQGLYSRFGYRTDIIARPETHSQVKGKDLILEVKLAR